MILTIIALLKDRKQILKTRAKLIERLKEGEHPEIVIVGGGANGAGDFSRFVSSRATTLLLEKGDYSSGTSASPSV